MEWELITHELLVCLRRWRRRFPVHYKMARVYLCIGHIRVFHIVQYLSFHGHRRRDSAKDR